MAGERTIRIKFDGSARGLKLAAAQAAREVDGVESAVKKKAGVFARLGQKIGLDMTEGLSGAFKSMPPQVQAAAVAAAVGIGATMAAMIGAAITAGVLLAVGGGVLAAGIVAASKSPAVKNAWTRFGDRAKAALKDFGTPFEGPLIRAADTFAGALERMAPTLKEMGKSMAPIVDKLAPALASMAEKALPGIQTAMEASKPLFDKLAEHAPKIGEAISKFFDKISDGSPGALLFLEHFLTAVEWVIVALGTVVGWLARMYETVVASWRQIKKAFAEGVKFILTVIGTIITSAAVAFGWIPGLGPKLKAAAQNFEKFRIKANAELDKIHNKTVTVTVQTAKAGQRSGVGGLGGLPRAHGGPVAAGRTYLVGEKGPELLTMGQSGHVTPNHQLGGGDTNVTVIIDGRALDSSVVRVVSERDRGLKRRALAGAGAR